MAERVAEVEMGALAFLKRVGLDHAGFDRDIVRDERGQIFHVQCQRAFDRPLQMRKPFGVANDVVLDALGQAAAQIA